MTDKPLSLKELEKKIFAMANAHIDSKECRRLYAVPLNRENAAFYILQRAHFVLNRRCCWAAVQSENDVTGVWAAVPSENDVAGVSAAVPSEDTVTPPS